MRCIDADALIDDIKNNLWDWETVDGITATTVLKQTISDIGNQPTIEPERKKGKWISGAENFNTNCSHECSQCGALIDMYHGGADDYFFCPNCGADMRDEKNEIDRCGCAD